MEARYVPVLLSMCCGLIFSPVKILPQSQQALQKAAPSAADKGIVKRGEAVFSK